MKNILLLDRNQVVNGTSVYYKNLSYALAKRANIYFYPFKEQAFYNEIALNTNIIKLVPFFAQKYNIDIIYVCTAEMFILALFFKKYFVKNAQIVYSVFHPRQNFFEDNIFGHVYKKIIYKKMLESPSVFVFYNGHTQTTHKAHYKLTLDDSRVFPVLISTLGNPNNISKSFTPPTSERESEPRALASGFPLSDGRGSVASGAAMAENKIIKIMSLGRLVDFKYYHEAVIQAISTISKAQNIKIEYHIYGDGHLRNKLENYIELTNSSEFVFLHGHLNTDKLYERLMAVDICIGTGTSLMYAASLGILSIVAIESSTLTYGFFTDDMPGYECGEEWSEVGQMTYETILNSFLQYNDVELMELKRKTMAKSEQYKLESNMDKLLLLLDAPIAKPLTGISLFSFVKVLIAKIGIKLLTKRMGDK